MSPRNIAFLSIVLAALGVLVTQTLSYGLVYPARLQGSKLGLVLALVAGMLAATFAGWLSLLARRRSTAESERFLALVALSVSAFFLFVIAFGFGIPSLIHSVRD